MFQRNFLTTNFIQVCYGKNKHKICIVAAVIVESRNELINKGCSLSKDPS
jgi:hypothetical protein